MTELEQLRAELKSLESLMGRHLGGTPLAAIYADVSNRVEKLEAEQADPWREAKTVVGEWIDGFNFNTRHGQVAYYARHLESENERLAARVTELEARPVPPLDPRRVHKTAMVIKHTPGIDISGWPDTKPYPLAESENERLAARVAELEARPVPPLDPKRVYMTARNMVHKSHPFGCYDENAELYSLAESEDGKSQ